MNSTAITPVILAGGKGTRLWPVSRSAMPKQFCKLDGDMSLFQQTIERLCGKPGFTDPVILTNASYVSLVRAQMAEQEVVPRAIICEPCGRDTGPAIALAAIMGKTLNLGLMLVLPSDHQIKDGGAFQEAVSKARPIADELQKIVTFGIKPGEPATGYGYLEAGEQIADGLGNRLLRFIEKPDAEKAEMLITNENIFWNAGVFMFSPKSMCRELEVHAPDLCSKVKKSVYACDLESNIVKPNEMAFSEIDPISIDYAVMEKTSEAALVPVDPQWSDVGSWGAVWEAAGHDEHGNAFSGNVVCVGTENSYVSSDGPFVGVSGLSDVIVVANRDAVLVTSRKESQSVKQLLDKVKEERADLTEAHVHENRPWGSFTSINKGATHQVKTITVMPGGQLSLQYHFYRSENWIVVKGTPTVTINNDVMQLAPCQQVFIPQGAVHRLENLTDDDVQIIEVQHGLYLGEDDIVRVEDVYGRPEVEIKHAERNKGRG